MTQGTNETDSYGDVLWQFFLEYGIGDYDMASLSIRGEIVASDPTVRYYISRWVKEKRLVRSRKKYYGRKILYLPNQPPNLLAHNYRVAKVTQHLLIHPPDGKMPVSRSSASVKNVQPDATLRFSSVKQTLIHMEYQTEHESWTTPEKIEAYRQATDQNSLKLFLIERDETFLLEMAGYAFSLVKAGEEEIAGAFWFVHPDTVLASRQPWSEALYYYGGSNGKRLPLARVTGQANRVSETEAEDEV